MTNSKGFAKLVIKPGTDEVICVHLLSPNVTEATLYIKHGKNIMDIIDKFTYSQYMQKL